MKEASQTTESIGVEESAEVRPFLSPESVVLDLGCGLGKIARHLAPHCRELYAADVSAVYLARAKKYLGGFPNVKMQIVNGKMLSPFRDSEFDVVYSMGVFVHIRKRDVPTYFREVYRVLKGGGVFYVHLPAPGTHHPVYETYTDNDIAEVLKSAPFTVETRSVHDKSLRLALRKV